MRTNFNLALGIVMLLLIPQTRVSAEGKHKPRVIITTDGEIDDKTSFVRFLMYANEFDIEGLIYGNSKWQRHGHGTVWMQETIDVWASVLDNILLHQKGYPDPEYLKSLCFAGNMDENFLHFTGPLETEGARHIINVLLEPDPRPVWVQAWGGTNTIAQAISILEKDYRRKDIVQAKSKLKIFAIADQDSTSAWIRAKHPETFYIQSHQFTALNYQHEGHPFSDHEIFSDEWTTCHVKKDHGPLGAMYAQSYFSEGDSPAFFHLIGNGLRADADPTWGGWGGRFVKQGANKYFSDAVDDGDRMHGQWIWLLDIQADFAARMDWCIMDYKSANHYPELPEDLPLEIQALPGDVISLDARGCSDPDGDKLYYRWWHYHFAGKSQVGSPLPIEGAEKAHAKICIPENVAGKELHVVLEVSDEAQNPLKRYHRIVIHIQK